MFNCCSFSKTECDVNSYCYTRQKIYMYIVQKNEIAHSIIFITILKKKCHKLIKKRASIALKVCFAENPSFIYTVFKFYLHPEFPESMSQVVDVYQSVVFPSSNCARLFPIPCLTLIAPRA